MRLNALAIISALLLVHFFFYAHPPIFEFFYSYFSILLHLPSSFSSSEFKEITYHDVAA